MKGDGWGVPGGGEASGQAAAIDSDVLAGHVVGGRRGEEHGNGADICWGWEFSDGDAVGESWEPIAEGLRATGGDETGADGVGGDAIGAKAQGEGAGELDHSTLAAGVCVHVFAAAEAVA